MVSVYINFTLRQNRRLVFYVAGPLLREGDPGQVIGAA